MKVTHACHRAGLFPHSDITEAFSLLLNGYRMEQRVKEGINPPAYNSSLCQKNKKKKNITFVY